MKKMLSAILVLLLLNGFVLAESIDWASMTDEELTAAIEAAQAELDARNNMSSDETASSAMDEKKITSPIIEGDGWEITHEYFCKLHDKYYYYCVLKNTSGYNASIDASVVFYDVSGNIVGVDESLEYACENGYETLWCFTNDIEFDHVEVNVSIEEDEWYKDGSQSALEYSTSIVGDKVIIQAKNTGTESIEDPMYQVLFLNEKGDVVDTDWGFLSYSDEIEPDATQLCDVSSYEKFTDVVVYIHGRISIE